MNNLQRTFTPANINTAGFASAVTGATFTLTANSSGDSLAHSITVKNNSATDHSGKTLALVGTDQNGKAQIETLTAPAASVSVTSAKYWLTLASITPSATIGADTFDIGWGGSFVTKTFPTNWRGLNASMRTDVTGTINYTLQQTFTDFQQTTNVPIWSVDDSTTQSAITAGISVVYRAHPRGIRLLINSYSNGATITFSYYQTNDC